MVTEVSQDPLELARACAAKMFADDRASQALGMQVDIVAPGVAEARMTVSAAMVNGHDICHGGYIFTLADSAFAFACNCHNRVTVAASCSIEFLASGKLGDRLLAVAREAHRGKRSGLYDVEITNQDGRLIASFRGRSAILNQSILAESGNPETVNESRPAGFGANSPP